MPLYTRGITEHCFLLFGVLVVIWDQHLFKPTKTIKVVFLLLQLAMLLLSRGNGTGQMTVLSFSALT